MFTSVGIHASDVTEKPVKDSFIFTLIKHSSQGGDNLARSNYQFKKRQKELARKKKKEEKRQRKQEKNTISSEENPEEPSDES